MMVTIRLHQTLAGSGAFNIKDENSNNGVQGWQAGDVYVCTVTCQQVGQGSGLNFFLWELQLINKWMFTIMVQVHILMKLRCNNNSFGGSANVDDTLVTTITLGTAGAKPITGGDITMTT